MSSTTQETWRNGALILLVLALLSSSFVFAAPNGATITSATTEYAPNRTAGSRTDDRGTVTTMLLNTIQQDQHWKAYVGNITGTLTLDDASNMTIYDWTLSTISGQVYASRYSNISWTGVTCATPAEIVSESFFHNMTDSDSDDLNSTFNWTIHKSFTVGTTTLAANTCNSTVTYANDTKQNPTAGAPYQEILIKDTNSYLVYLTGINDNVQGFDNQTYDFQMMVAESNVKASATTYYFYVELR